MIHPHLFHRDFAKHSVRIETGLDRLESFGACKFETHSVSYARIHRYCLADFMRSCFIHVLHAYGRARART